MAVESITQQGTSGAWQKHHNVMMVHVTTSPRLVVPVQKRHHLGIAESVEAMSRLSSHAAASLTSAHFPGKLSTHDHRLGTYSPSMSGPVPPKQLLDMGLQSPRFIFFACNSGTPLQKSTPDKFSHAWLNLRTQVFRQRHVTVRSGF